MTPDRNNRTHRLVQVTDPVEIQAIQDNELHSPIGGLWGELWLAERSTLEGFRKWMEREGI